MIEIVLYFALAFGGGYWAGHKDSKVIAECKQEPLIITECGEIFPPADATFGATTNAYIDLVGRYKLCKAACTNPKE